MKELLAPVLHEYIWEVLSVSKPAVTFLMSNTLLRRLVYCFGTRTNHLEPTQ
jgi:hypothetical protein